VEEVTFQTCFIGLLNDIKHAADQRKVTVCVLFDFSKAFDRGQHKILIDKTQKFASFLFGTDMGASGRTQVVRDSGSGSVSTPDNIIVGVPLCSGACIIQLISDLRACADIIFMPMT